MAATLIDTQYIRQQVRNIVDPMFLQLREAVYGSGITYNRYISSSVIPPATPTDTGGVTLSNNTPQIVNTAGAVPGTASSVSRSDHKHALATTTVASGTYGNSTHIPIFTVGIDGRLTYASGIPFTLASITYSGLTTGQPFRATSATTADFGPLDLGNTNATTSLLLRSRGGTGINAQSTGPGVLKQVTGAGNFTVAPVTAQEIDCTTVPGANRTVFTFDSGGGTASFESIDLTGSLTALSNALPATHGGTGLTSYTAGDLLYATPPLLSKLAAVASGQVLKSNGVATAPVWGKVNLATDVTGILPTSNGGNGTGFTLGSIPFANASGNLIENNSNLYWDNTNLEMFVGPRVTVSGGLGKLNIRGTDSSITGPHVTFYTTIDNHPVLQFLNYTHNNIQLSLDCYYDSSAVLRSSSAGSNFQVLKVSDLVRLRYANGAAVGSVPTFEEFMRADLTTGYVTIGEAFTSAVPFTVMNTSATTNAAVTNSAFYQRTSGTAANGFGQSTAWLAESSTGADRSTFTLQTIFSTATDASRKARASFFIYDTAAREAIRLDATGSAATISLLGDTSVTGDLSATGNVDGATIGTVGTWTPTLKGTITAGTFTYAIRTGRYYKLGKLVVAHAEVQISAISVAPTGSLRIGSLPFTALNADAIGDGSIGILYSYNTAAGALWTSAQVIKNTTDVAFWENYDNANSTLATAAGVTTTFYISLTLIYTAA